VQGDALYDAGDFLGRGSALRDRRFHDVVGLHFPTNGYGRVICQEADPGRFGGYRSYEKAFWATLERHRRRETAPSFAKNTSVAAQQGRAPNALATGFLLIAAGILAARILWRMPE
jgi:hypothetical protein